MHSFIPLIRRSRNYKTKKYIVYGIIHVRINYKRQHGKCKHEFQGGSYSRRERNVIREAVMVWMFVSPAKFTCWDPNPKVMVWAGGVCGKRSGHKGGALMSGIRDLIKGTSESSFTPSAMWGHSQMTAIYEPGHSPSQTPNLPMPWSWTSHSPNCEK